VPGGTLEEITYYLNILKIFEEMGVRVINTAQKIESTVDKLYTSYFLSKNNIKTPDTFVFRGYEKAKNFLDNEMSEKGIVYKPLFGSQGDNVKLIKHPSELKETDNFSNIYYFQDYLDNTVNHDYRILVIRNNDACKYFYMTRYGDTFINNVSKGGSCVKEPLNEEITDLALKASRLLNMSFCGVDIMSCNNSNYIIEINSIPAWRGLQDVEEEIISDYFVNLLMA
jgi:RimK family alpha-L-glutamate ligase